MQIYTVRSGDTLYNIAKAFGSTVNDIVKANRIPRPDSLVVGQTLVIPIYGSYYFVKQGESLWKIGRKFGINYIELARVNNISPDMTLPVGLRLYIPPYPKVTAEINAYAEPAGERASRALLEDTENAAPELTYLTAFSYQAKRDGSLTAPPLKEIAEIAERYGNSLMMAVTNIENGQFSGELGKNILESEAVQDKLIDSITEEAKKAGVFSDIHFDFEFLPPEMREPYNAFLAKAAKRLRAEGFTVSAALAPKTSATQQGQWYEAHDYRTIGSLMDYVVIMTYEWGYSGGPPLPVSPINEVKKVLDYALTEIPANKILMGQNLYGYDWKLPFKPGTYATAISPQRAIEIAGKFGAQIQFDSTAQAPYFEYTDADKARHIVWFEDARSIQAKFNLLKKLGLRGISYWKLGFSFPQNWLLTEDNFNIIKK
jgi:spore germination protein